jgi:hypothetical protein
MRHAVVLAGLLLAAGGAVAQHTSLSPSAAVACLSPPPAERGAPEYPFEAFKNKLPGDVQVRLRFTGPGLAPQVTVVSQQGDTSFIGAVRSHVATLRLPCHDGAEPVDLDFSFAFRPDETPLSPVPIDPADTERQRQLQCLEHRSGHNMPSYPLAAQMTGVQARIPVQLRFEAPDQPPAVRLLPRVGGDSPQGGRYGTDIFLATLRTWADGYRMPCLSGGPITMLKIFVFRIEGDAWGFKPGVSLRELLPLVRNIRQQRLQFDFSRMQCPFAVRVEYLQPNLPNRVRQIGSPVAARQPFIDWLVQTQFDMPPRSLDAVYGDVLTITVPCLKIDLNPTGVTS